MPRGKRAQVNELEEKRKFMRETGSAPSDKKKKKSKPDNGLAVLLGIQAGARRR